MKNLAKKFTSRKFLAALAGLVSGLAVIFGLDESIVAAFSGAILSAASLITYIITEGRVDAEAVKNTVIGIQKAADSLDGENTGD